MESKVEEKKVIYTLRCAKCEIYVEVETRPAPKMNGFLCNMCWMKWEDTKRKLEGKTYADEMRRAFINFINTRPWT